MNKMQVMQRKMERSILRIYFRDGKPKQSIRNRVGVRDAEIEEHLLVGGPMI